MDFRLHDYLDIAKKELPKEKRLHKEIKKLAKQTNNAIDVFLDIGDHLSGYDLLDLGWNFEYERVQIEEIFTLISYDVENVLEDIFDEVDEPDRELSNAYDILKDAKVHVKNLFNDAVERVKKAAKKLGVDITKELKNVLKERDLSVAAEKLAKLVDDFALVEI